MQALQVFSVGAEGATLSGANRNSESAQCWVQSLHCLRRWVGEFSPNSRSLPQEEGAGEIVSQSFLRTSICFLSFAQREGVAPPVFRLFIIFFFQRKLFYVEL